MPVVKSDANKPAKAKSDESLEAVKLDDVYVAEDSEAESKNPAEEIAAQAHVCSRIKTLLESYVKAAAQHKPGELPELRRDIMLGVAELKRFNRLAQFRNKRMRDKTAQERQGVDEQYLQLQNLLYEVLHLQKEVSKCLEFKSAHEEIDLVPIEQFYRNAPPDICKPEITKRDSHQLRLGRLNWELEERKLLSEKLATLQKQYADLTADIESKQESLESLAGKLTAINDASKPVQAALGVDYEKASRQKEYLPFLPLPLHVLYIHCLAYKEISDKKLTVAIEGDLEAVKEKEKQKATGDSSDSESDTEETAPPVSSTEQGVRIRKKKRRKTITDLLDESRHVLLSLHPLRVVVRFPCRDKGNVVLVFSVLDALNIVTVKCVLEVSASLPRAVANAKDLLCGSSVLQELLPSDDGKACPNAIAALKLERAGVDLLSSVDTVGSVFTWAQKIAGLHVVDAALTSSARQSMNPRAECVDHLQLIIAKVKSRFLARLALYDQLASLESLNVSSLVPKECVYLFPKRLAGRLMSWKAITVDDYRAHAATQALIESGFSNGDGGWYFQANVERTEAKLTAVIRIPVDYPQTMPCFLLALTSQSQMSTAANSEALRDVERLLNVNFPTALPRAARNFALCCQTAQLISSMDVLLEIESVRSGTATTAAKEHLFVRKARGRNREIPMYFNSSTHLYAFDAPLPPQ